MSKPKKVTLVDGTIRWRIVVDAGRDPETGTRRQLTKTYDRFKDANGELARVQNERNKGTYVAPSKLTLNVMLDGWLESACFEKEAGTRSNYGHALRPARERLGDRLVQSLTREDIEDLRNWMMSAGRKRGGTPGTSLGPRSVRLTLSRLSAAFDQALDDGKVTRNPCARVRRPKMMASAKTSWLAEEARQFLGEAAADRLHAAWLMAMYGGRREEICGARWEEDIDLAAGSGSESRVVLRRVRPGQQAGRDAAHHPARGAAHLQHPHGTGRRAGLHPGRMVRAHHRGQQDHVPARAARGPGLRA